MLNYFWIKALLDTAQFQDDCPCVASVTMEVINAITKIQFCREPMVL